MRQRFGFRVLLHSALPTYASVTRTGFLVNRHARMAMQFVLVLGALVGGFSNTLAAGKIYWTETAAPPDGEIRRANLDGTGMETIVTGLGDQYDVALDLAADKIYWVERFPASIRRANLDGSGIEDVTPPGDNGGPISIDLDLQHGKMYWTTFSNQSRIWRANLDGTGAEFIYSGIAPDEQLLGIALDAGGGKVYWTDSGDNGRIRRANLDGSGVQTLLSTSSGPTGIDLDLVHEKIYWAGFDAIRRCNLDGSAVELLVSTNFPLYVALDTVGGKLYWSGFGPGRIQRANLDGTGVETLITGIDPRAIEVDPEGSDGLTVNVDIKPRACPNPINMKMRSGNAVIPAAILGTFAFDVTDIDPSTVTLEGVPALRSSIEDVSTPPPPDPGECECTTEGSDGIPDLVLHFNYVAVVQALGPQQAGAFVPVTVSGQLTDGTPFTGQDCFLIHHGITVLQLAGQITADESDGDFAISGASTGVPALGTVPKRVFLAQNAPQPFSQMTTVRFDLPTSTTGELTVYSIGGRVVRRLVSWMLPEGTWEGTWDGRDEVGNRVASGTYVLMLSTPEGKLTRRMTVLR